MSFACPILVWPTSQIQQSLASDQQVDQWCGTWPERQLLCMLQKTPKLNRVATHFRKDVAREKAVCTYYQYESPQELSKRLLHQAVLHNKFIFQALSLQLGRHFDFLRAFSIFLPCGKASLPDLFLCTPLSLCSNLDTSSSMLTRAISRAQTALELK